MQRTRISSFSAAASRGPRGSPRASPLPSNEEEEQADPLAALVKLLTRPSNQRNNPKSLTSLINFVKEIKFFKQLAGDVGEDAVLQCCLHLTYENYSQGQVLTTQFVFMQGDEGSKFYVLLEGKVAVYLNLERENGARVPTEVAALGKGDSFGELALMQNKPRAATIGCTQDCHFAVLDKSDYLRILSKVHEQQLSQKIDFLQALPMFHNWTRNSMQKITFYFKEKTFARKQVLCKVGSTATEVFLIRDGEVEVIKERQTRTPTAAFRSPRTVTTYAELAILGVGESIGHEEVISGAAHKFTYVCHSSSVRVLSITKEDFVKRVHTEDSWNYLKAMTSVKGDMRQQRLSYLENIDFLKPDKCQSRPGSSLSVPSADFFSPARQVQTPKQPSRDPKSQESTPGRKVNESPEPLVRLYPFKRDVRDSGLQSRCKAIRNFRRLKSWDQIFARKTIDMRAKMESKASSRTTVVNIHTHLQRMKALHRFSGSDGGTALMKSLTGVFFTSKDSGMTLTQPCLTINTIEMGRFCEREQNSGKKLTRIVRSSHSQFRVKRYNSAEVVQQQEEVA